LDLKNENEKHNEYKTPNYYLSIFFTILNFLLKLSVSFILTISINSFNPIYVVTTPKRKLKLGKNQTIMMKKYKFEPSFVIFIKWMVKIHPKTTMNDNIDINKNTIPEIILKYVFLISDFVMSKEDLR
jgi:hypothetical protein